MDSILSLVGNTPKVRLSKRVLSAFGVRSDLNVFVKLEAANPGGSVKDRMACAVLEWGEKNGKLVSGQTVVEASSGNTGIGLAMACASKGYPFVCVMSEAFSIERRKLMRFLGAQVVLTNPAHKGTGMILKARQLAAEYDWYNPRQFENEANAWAHYNTTAPEILQAFPQGLDYFVCAYGTGGTLKGVSTAFREKSPKTKVVVCEPDNAPLLYSNIRSEYPVDDKDGTASSFKEPHPLWRPHLLQGWAPDFIPKLVDEAVTADLVDEIVHVGGSQAMNAARVLARTSGIMTGTSGGGTLAGALEYLKKKDKQGKLEPGASTLVVLADTAERYLSTPLFADIQADMTPEEAELAKVETPPPVISLPEPTRKAVSFLEQENEQHQVVIWSLEYCEFCWTLVDFFKAIGVEATVINIDAFQYAKDNFGNKVRAALSAKTGCNTFPQCFISKEFMGGAADACLKWKSGELQTLFKEKGVVYNDKYEGDPFEFLPKWMSQNPLRHK